MLEPDARHLLTDALRPPDGHRLDLAVATTYSLDVNSLILAPLAMAAHDHLGGFDGADPDPLTLLESVRRYADRTTVFTQAGAIHVPSQYQRVLAFAEGCVVEVSAPEPDRLFHPKVWVLRFVAPDGTPRHRFLCLSRNLTADRSWDTVLRLEQSESGKGASPAPLVGFLKDLPTLTTQPLQPDRLAQIKDLCTTLGEVTLQVPSPFTNAQLWPMGTSTGRGWPFPERATRLIAISPFLDAGFVRRIPSTKGSRFVSRSESFDRLGASGMPDSSSAWVLQAAADSPDIDTCDADPSTQEMTGRLDPSTGLHAKVFVWDYDGRGHVVTGSANATSAAFGGNVEFSVLLTGPASSCGVPALWAEGKEAPGLPQLLEPYEASTEAASDDRREALEREIEQAHAALCRSGIEVTVTSEGEDHALTLEASTTHEQRGASTTLCPLAIAHSARPLAPRLVWRPVAIQNISPFVIVETTLTRDGVTARRSCVVKGNLTADLPDRQRSILRSLLSHEHAILRYLALLLGDPAFDAMMAALQEELSGRPRPAHQRAPGPDDLVLFEPLIRATTRHDGSLERVERLFAELRDDDGELRHLSPDFRNLWSVVWAAVKETVP